MTGSSTSFFADRVAVGFITLSLAATGLLGYTVAQDYQNRGNSNGTTAQGNSSQTGSDTPADTSTTAPTDTGAAPTQAAGTTTTTSGGGGGARSTARAALATTQAESGVSHDKILVGGIFDMTGPVDSSVERDTVRAYFSKINAQGGINGRQIIMLPCDGYYDNVHSKQCALNMVDNKVLAMVGNTFPGGENDQVPFLNKEGIPTIGGLGVPHEYDDSDIKGCETCAALSYPVSPSFIFSGNGLAAQLKAAQASSPFFRHPAILYINDVPWVAPVVDAILKALDGIGVKPTLIEPASATNDPDYTQHVANMEFKSGGDPRTGPCASGTGVETPGACPDSIIAATDPFSYAKLFQAMDRVNWHPPVVAGGLDKGNQQEAYGDQLGCPSCGTGGAPRQAFSLTPFLTPYDPVNTNNPTIRDYLDSVQRFFPNQVPALDVYTQIAWSSAQVFVEAVKRAGANLTRQTLVAALNSIKGFDTGWSTPLSYSPGNSHDPNHCYYDMKHDAQDAHHGGTWRQYTGLQCY